jgi:hypothetical protein
VREVKRQQVKSMSWCSLVVGSGRAGSTHYDCKWEVQTELEMGAEDRTRMSFVAARRKEFDDLRARSRLGNSSNSGL